MMTKKKTLGRQKIEMKKIERVNQRYVTFSKRRASLFNKAAELCLITDANVVALVTSAGNHTFAFSSQPNPEDLLHHVIPRNGYEGPNSSSSSSSRLVQINDHEMISRRENIRELNERYQKLTATLEEEEKMGKTLEEENSKRAFWWKKEIEVEKLGAEELEYYMMAMRETKSDVQKILMERGYVFS